jgi:hypothetical protein
MYNCQLCHSSYAWPHDLTRHIRRKHDPEQQIVVRSYKVKMDILNNCDKGNNKITELRTILQRESQNS